MNFLGEIDLKLLLSQSNTYIDTTAAISNDRVIALRYIIAYNDYYHFHIKKKRQKQNQNRKGK